MQANDRQRYILGATIGYATFAALWILLSDKLLVTFTDGVALQWLSTAKGLFFVIVTTLLLFAALRGVPAEEGGDSSASAGSTLLPSLVLPRAWGYVLAVLVTVAMVAVRSGIAATFGERPMMNLFMLPIILSAVAGGLGSGLVATMTAALSVSYFVIPPIHSFWIAAPYDLFQWSLLIANGMLISCLSEVLHRLRRQAEVARKLHAVTVASIGDGVITTDMAGRITFMNREAERLTGRSNRGAQGLPLTEVFKAVDEETRQPLENPVARVLASGHGLAVANHHLLAAGAGREVSIQDSAAPIRLDAGAILGVVLVFRDDTERRCAEKALLASEATYRSLFDNLLNSVVHCRMIFEDGRPVDMEYLAVNPAFERVTGIRQAVVGRRVNEVIPGYGQNNPESLAKFGEVAQSGEPVRWEHYLAALDRWFSFSIYSPARGEVVVVTENISERKQAELALQKSEARFRQLFAVVPVPLYFGNKEGVLVECNERFVQAFGYSREEVPNLEAWWPKAYPDPGYRSWVQTTWQAAVLRAAAARTDIEPLEYRVTCKDGRVRTLVISGVIIGEGVLATFFDVTERKEIEQELRDSLAEKVVLLKEVHHRVKNNLQIVSSLLSLQADRLANPEALQALHDTQNRIRSMALLHETLYRSDNLARINLPAYIRDLCAQVLMSFGPAATRVRVEDRIEAIALPMEQAVPCSLIINELVSNALKHGFPAGRSGWVLVELGPDENQELVLRVSDNGVGVGAGFEAAATATLGLQLVRNLAAQLAGRLTVESPPAGGAVFVIKFPLPKEILFGGQA